MHQMPSIDAFRLLRTMSDAEQAMTMTRVEAKARIRFTVAQALAQGRVSFHYQPVVRAENPRMPAFYEMLARLRLPNGQVLPAGGFMPAVEDGILGRAIDRLGLAHALRALAAKPGLRLSVNMSPLSMGDEEWLAILAAAHRQIAIQVISSGGVEAWRSAHATAIERTLDIVSGAADTEEMTLSRITVVANLLADLAAA